MSSDPCSRHLLIPEHPYLLLPSLAQAIGVEAAIVLQQLHFKLVTAGRDVEGERWFYNTLARWNEVFPFFSKRALERVFKALREAGLIRVRYDLNRHAYDRTAWYAIDYDAVDRLGLPKWADERPDPEQLRHSANLAVCTAPTSRQNGEMHSANLAGSIPPKRGNAFRQNGGIPKDLSSRSKDTEIRAREGENTEPEETPSCHRFDWTAVRALNAPLCSHLQETLALFRDLAYACEEAYYRKDANGRLHEFAHDYTLEQQRAYIAYRQHQLQAGELAPRFRSPSAMFKPDWVASDMPAALDRWRRRHAAEQPESCPHKNVTVDGLCLQCRQQFVRRPKEETRDAETVELERD